MAGFGKARRIDISDVRRQKVVDRLIKHIASAYKLRIEGQPMGMKVRGLVPICR